MTHPTVEKAVLAHDNLVLRKTMMKRHKNVVVWDSLHKKIKKTVFVRDSVRLTTAKL